MVRCFSITLLVLGLACSTTRIVDTWTEPGLKPSDLQFQQVVVLAISPKEGRRRTAEDAFIAAMESKTAKPAYAMLLHTDVTDTGKVRAVLEAAGVDGAIVIRFVSSEQKQIHVPGATYAMPSDFFNYHQRGWTYAVDPGYMRTDTYVKLETSLYDVKRGKLLWSATSETLNPSSVDKIISELVDAAGRELTKQGLRP